MAFGKDRSVLTLNFRQQGKRSMQRNKSVKGNLPYFVNKYQPPLGVHTDTIRLLVGQYSVPIITDKGTFVMDDAGQIVQDVNSFYKYTLHFHGGKKKSTVCSAGPLSDFKGKADPCNGCDWFWYEWDQRKSNGADRPKSISRRDMWAFSVLVLAPFHKMDDLDRETGEIRRNDRGEPYYNWIKCQGRGCDGCAAGKETKQGHRLHWSMGMSHANTLFEYERVVGNHCRVCCQADCVQSVAWICQNPDCGEAVIEMAKTSLKDEEIDKLTSFESICPHCGVKGWLKELHECVNCKGAGREGDRATLFDVDLSVKRVEASDGSDQTTLSIVRHSLPKPIDAIYGEELRKPLNLPAIFSPTDMERQIALFGKAPSRGQNMQRAPVNSAAG